MRTCNDYIKRLITTIATGGLVKYDVEIMSKIKMINIMSIIAIAILVPFGIVDLIKGSSTIGLFVLIIAAVLIFNQLFLRKSGNYRFPMYSGIAIVGAYFLYALVTGGVNNTGFLWYFTFPLFSLFLLGAKRGALASLLVLSLAIIFFSAHPRSSLFIAYSLDFKIRFALSYLVISSFSYLFETLRERAQQTLSLKNAELENTITELRESEDLLQKAHVELERRVKERTAELVNVNTQLKKEVDERKEAEEALRDSEEKYRTILESIEEGYFEVDLKGTLVFFNDALCKVIGYSRKELTGMNNRDYTTQETAKKMYQTFNQVYRTGGPAKVTDYKIITKEGKTITVEMSTSLMRDASGNPIGFRGVVRDVTERKTLEAQLQYAQRMEALGTLAGGIAHNFNNLLMGIMGNTSLMLLETQKDNPNFERLRKIERLVESGSLLTKQLLGYARKGRYEIKPLDINRVVKEASDTFAMTKKDITIRQQLNAGVSAVKADRGQIEQILWNLYVNAADAMPSGGELFLKTMNTTNTQMKGKPYKIKPGSYVVVTVTDTGIGMDKRTMERIFEPFFTTKGLAAGTGLGLASVYGMVKAHGGYIDVDSKKGGGTTFSIYLPSSGEEVQEIEAPPETIKEGKETLLLVDDEQMVLDVDQEMLEMMGYTVLVARGGNEAIEIYREKYDDINMVILDMIMPDMSGEETYEKLKAINPKVKVLLTSGYSVDGQAAEILERGCDGFIQKPFDMKEASHKVREILDK